MFSVGIRVSREVLSICGLSRLLCMLRVIVRVRVEVLNDRLRVWISLLCCNFRVFR